MTFLNIAVRVPSMVDISMSVNGVAKQLSKLNPGKAPGPNLPPGILKELHYEKAPILAILFYFLP